MTELQTEQPELIPAGRRRSVSVINSTVQEIDTPLVYSSNSTGKLPKFQPQDDAMYATLLRRASDVPVFPAPAFSKRTLDGTEIPLVDLDKVPTPPSPTSPVTPLKTFHDLTIFSAPMDQQLAQGLEKEASYKVKPDAKIVFRDSLSAIKMLKTHKETLSRSAQDTLSRSGSSTTMACQSLGYKRTEKTRLLAKRKPAVVETEVRVLSSCPGHPNIPSLIDFWVLSDAYVELLHPCPSGSLIERVNLCNPQLTEKQSANIMSQLASALYFLHSIGIIHKNVQPAQILLKDAWTEQDNTILLGGFGYATTVTGDNDALESETIQFTSLDPTGSFQCLTPEQIPGSPYPMTAKIDSFQLGIVMYYLVSGGVHPFIPTTPLSESLSTLDIVKNVAQGNYFEMTGSRFVHISPECRGLIEKLLQPNPARRPTARQVLEDEWMTKFVKKQDLQYLGEVSRRKSGVIRAFS